MLRLDFVFDKNTPSFTACSWPSTSTVSTWALDTVTEPVRALYWARAATPRSKAAVPPLDALAGAFCSGGRGGDAELVQMLALPAGQPGPDHVLTLLVQPASDVQAAHGDAGQELAQGGRSRRWRTAA